MKKHVTMSMIAKECDTSIGTVDRALKNRGDINPETRRIILEKAKELGYKSIKSTINKGFRIAFIYPALPIEFYSSIRLGVEKAGSEVSENGIEIDTLNFDATNPNSQIELLKSIDINRYDAFAINPLSPLCSSCIEQLSANGKTVVLFNNDIQNSSRAFYVGSNSVQSGRMGAEILGLLLGGKGGVSVLGNFVHIVPFIERFDGFCQVIHENYPEISIYSCADCRLDRELTEKNIANLLLQAPDLKGLFCTGYSSTVDAINALKKLGRTDIKLVGYDVSTETAEAVKNGTCKALLYQDPYQQAYQTCKLLCRYLCENWRPNQTQLFIDTRVVFRQNIENYYGFTSEFVNLTF